MSLAGFDPNEVAPAGSFEPIPAGEYELMVTETEWHETKSGTGRYLKLTVTVLDAEYDGRLIWENLNLENPSDTAVRIAMGSLSALCRAIGHMEALQTDDASELCNRPFRAKVGIQPAKGQYEASNKIVAYLPADAPASKAAPKRGRGKAPAAAPEKTEKVAPWLRK